MRMGWGLFLLMVVQGLHAGVKLASPPLIDMGKVLEKTVVEGRFQLANESDSTFHIRHVRTSCGCTVVSIPDSTLNPLDTVSVPFSINTARFSGVIRKIITVEFVEPVPEIEAAVQIQVFQNFEIRPRILSLRNVQIGSEPVPRAVSIINNTLRPLKIRGVRSDDSSLTVTPDKTMVPSLGEADFKIVFSPVKPETKTIYVMFETDNEESPTLEFPVTVQVVP
jgi:hypothetical protein